LPLRISILILLGLISLANELGMEIVFGAYTAGAVIAILIRDTAGEILEDRLISVGSGFLVPLFFITSGIEFDIHALVSSPVNLVRLICFVFGLLAIRIIPVCLFRRALPERDLIPLALYSSTTLPLVVAITYLGVRTGHMLPENGSALVGAAIVSVTLFPIAANWLRAQPPNAHVNVYPNAFCAIFDFVTERISCYFTFLLKPETPNKPELRAEGRLPPRSNARGNDDRS
jgi:Kef-type K+ transport system membrane component KefB